MTNYIELQKASEEVNHLSKEEMRILYQKSRDRLKSMFYFFIIAMFISPFLAYFIFFYALLRFNREFLRELFSNRKKFVKYQTLFQIQMKKNVLSIIGYRVEDHEIEDHLAIIKAGDKKALAKKQLRHERKDMAHTHVGFDHKLLTTHLALIGKTGSGKTEGIRSLFNTMGSGSGFLMNDGKSDENMLNEFLQQAKRLGRETSAQVLNFLKAAAMGESNTINLLSMMHPVKIVEFLGGLIDTGGGGNEKYFFNRGKAMLFPSVSGLAIRDRIKNEGIDFEKIAKYTEIGGIVQLWTIFYCMNRDVNQIIKNNKKISKILDNQIASKENKDFEYIEKLIDYIIQEPTKKDFVERTLQIEYPLIKEMYNNVFITIENYMAQVWNQYGPLMGGLTKIMYIVGKHKQITFFDTDFSKCADIQTYKDLYKLLKESTESDDSIKELWDEYEITTYGGTTDNMRQLKKCFASGQQVPGNIENPPSTAIQQHAYAQQQWTTLFNLFTAYKHVFGQSKSEIDPKKVLTDNKFLYILLPPLDTSRDQVNILGKIIIMIIKEVASIALQGEKISVHRTLKNISKDQATPKPYTPVVLDEYGAYPVDELDTILAQVRSINLGVILGIQDMASLKAGGDNITSQERALANLTKMILKAEDKTTAEWIGSMIGKKKVRVSDRQLDAFGDITDTNTTTVQEVDMINVPQLMDLDTGFSVLIGGSTNDKIVYIQTFFRGGKKGSVSIKRYKNLVF